MARVTAVIAKIRELLQKNRIARYGLVILVVVVAGYLIAGRLFGGRGAPQPATRLPVPAPSAPRAAAPPPAPGTTPAPVPAAPGAPGTTAPPKTSVVPPGPTGRPDPLIPLSVATPPGQPPGSLPPPPFPVPGQLPPPPLPGQVPGVPGGPVAVTGIVGNSKAVAVIVIGGRSEIVAPGDQIGDLRVLRIDSTRRTVTFLQAGRRFDVALGGE